LSPSDPSKSKLSESLVEPRDLWTNGGGCFILAPAQGWLENFYLTLTCAIRKIENCIELVPKEEPGMAGIIEVDSRGGPAAQFIEKAICTLRDEFARSGLKIRSLRLESIPPVPQIVVGIITPVPPSHIVKLLDTILKARADAEKKLDSPRINIFVTHQEGGVRFTLPDEREKCEKYFESLSS
jgi:hypothetical protein